MTSRSQIFIADLLHSLDALGIETIDTAREVMRMLSLEEWHEIVSSRTVREAADHGVVPSAAKAFPTLATTSASRSASPERGTDSTLGQIRISRVVSPGAPVRPTWLDHVTPLERAVRAQSPPPESLLDPRQERALLGGLSACLGDDGNLNVERLVDSLAKGTMPQELPLQPSWTTRRGLQVLIDDGPGMAPFRGDVARVMDRLGALLSRDRLDRLSFEGSPMRGCRTPRRRGRHPWKPPVRGGAVLVLTDLGIAAADPLSARGTIGEWLEFADVAQTAGVQLRSLVPYPSNRWPGALASRLHPVPWDRRTTVAMVRRAVSAAAQHRIA
jgi:hypothetical protein